MIKLCLRVLWAAVFALSTCSAAAQVVINEVLYDPEGGDTGLEFVELLNCGRHGVLLTGWVLETGNGAHPDDWTVEWIGGDLDYLEPGQMFVIGEVDVLPAPDYATPLDLQNGPDGVRITDGVDPVDVVGWGEPLFQEYYEGTPAVDAPSGLSLARSPDCFDHGDNALDFVAGPPTPGARNALSHDLCLRVRHP
ncbi:lamin tail domain-containing protein, partial [bacterium]|nr:lamin tail domain-containing protein [bacterium]